MAFDIKCDTCHHMEIDTFDLPDSRTCNECGVDHCEYCPDYEEVECKVCKAICCKGCIASHEEECAEDDTDKDDLDGE